MRPDRQKKLQSYIWKKKHGIPTKSVQDPVEIAAQPEYEIEEIEDELETLELQSMLTNNDSGNGFEFKDEKAAKMKQENVFQLDLDQLEFKLKYPECTRYKVIKTPFRMFEFPTLDIPNKKSKIVPVQDREMMTPTVPVVIVEKEQLKESQDINEWLDDIL
jgi:hypothetical protein